MFKKLARLELVTYVPYQGVSLKPEGERLALRLTCRHRLLVSFLAETLDVSVDRISAEADRLGPHVSAELEALIAAWVGEARAPSAFRCRRRPVGRSSIVGREGKKQRPADATRLMTTGRRSARGSSGRPALPCAPSTPPCPGAVTHVDLSTGDPFGTTEETAAPDSRATFGEAVGAVAALEGRRSNLSDAEPVTFSTREEPKSAHR